MHNVGVPKRNGVKRAGIEGNAHDSFPTVPQYAHNCAPVGPGHNQCETIRIAGLHHGDIRGIPRLEAKPRSGRQTCECGCDETLIVRRIHEHKIEGGNRPFKICGHTF